MHGPREIVLSVAGFDPSAGAGVLADIKTFERFRVYGLGISTATTFQTDKVFQDCIWVKVEEVLRQLNLLFDRFEVACVKIGIVPDIYFLSAVISEIKSLSPDTAIVWDPVYKSSTGFSLFKEVGDDFILAQTLGQLTLITPNHQEALFFGKEDDEQKSAKKMSAFCNVLLKDGHGTGATSTDILYLKNGDEIKISSERIQGAAKHGSGCVLSAAIASLLAQGHNADKACREAKEYISKFLTSSKELLGYHAA
ncbi:MAG: hydroxymethylpyrimidine/phosphomethylpyrimidine kinase [Flavobacteriales bacterium]